MVKRLLVIAKCHWPLLITILFYLSMTLPALLTRQHLLYNLEPYPDALLYTHSAFNLAHGQGLNMDWSQGLLAVWTPPLYQLYLAIFYLFSSTVVVFYVANVFLGLASLFMLYIMVKSAIKQPLMHMFALAMYATNAYVLWIPTLAMTENLSMFLFMCVMYGIVTHSKSALSVSILGALGLIGARYSNLFITIIGLLLIAITQWKYFTKKVVLVLGGMAIVFATVLYIYLEMIGQPPLALLSVFFKPSLYGNVYYSNAFVQHNIAVYSKALTGRQAAFLWETSPLTSVLVFALFSWACVQLVRTKHYRTLGLSVGLLFLVQFPLLLQFHVADSRYIFPVLILFAITLPIAVSLMKYRTHVLLTCFVVVILSVSWVQRGLLREVVGNNILGRSVAWQYESIKTFNSYFSKHPGSSVITALPPYLIESYRESDYAILPLSTEQEFIHKGEFIWGENVPYTDLQNGYEKMVEHGKQLYVSNAYISHKAEVTDDFHTYEKQFNLRLVQEGCLGTCNIYALEKKAL